MRIRSAALIVVGAAALATVLPHQLATAAPDHGWSVGDCFTSASTSDHGVDLSSKVDCRKPHALQVLAGAKLPAGLTNHSVRPLQAVSQQACSGRNLAPGIWPKQGAAMARALSGLAASAAGGVLPSLPVDIAYAWVLPDEKSTAAGDRSMLCVVAPLGKKALTGDVQLLGTSRTLPGLRTCFDDAAAADLRSEVSCARPHGDELLLQFKGRLPVTYGAMTDALWAPFDAQCDSLLDVLVGANRKDLRAFADASPTSAASVPVYLACYASRPQGVDGSRPRLPGGTVVGLAKTRLGTAG